MRAVAESADLQAELREALTTIDSLLEGESMFSDRDAYWANGTEVVHFESDGAVEVRLTKGVISARRAALKADSRVELRRSGADWLTVHMAEAADIAFVVDLVRAAERAHRPADGSLAKPLPTGAELARRKRFH